MFVPRSVSSNTSNYIIVWQRKIINLQPYLQNVRPLVAVCNWVWPTWHDINPQNGFTSPFLLISNTPNKDPKMNRSNTKKGFRRWNSTKVARDGRWINGRIPATSVTASAKGGHNLAADHRSFCLLPCASMDLGGSHGGGEVSYINPHHLLAMCGNYSLPPIYGWNPMSPSIWVDCHNSTAG